MPKVARISECSCNSMVLWNVSSKLFERVALSFNTEKWLPSCIFVQYGRVSDWSHSTVSEGEKTTHEAAFCHWCSLVKCVVLD